jgi:hypothetical protein
MEIVLTAEIKPRITHSTVVIAGDGRTLLEDIEAIDSLVSSYDTYPIGRSINVFPVVDHWGNVDCNESIWWAENLPNKWRGQPQRHTLGPCRGFDFYWDIPQIDYDIKDLMWHGSTALFAVHTSLAMGYERVVLAGCPLDGAGHWYFGPEDKGPRWTGECYQAWLDFSICREARKVRSLSGYTKIILGEPTREWVLNGH